MPKVHHNLPVIMIVGHLQREVRISKEEIRQALIASIAPVTTKQGIKSLSILMVILMTRKLVMMGKFYGIETHVIFMACITMLLSSVGK